MASKAGEHSLQTMYKSRRDREGQASVESRRKSIRMERKQRKDEKMDLRRGLLGMSTLSESTDTDDLDDLDLDEDQNQLKVVQAKSKSGKKAAEKSARALSLKERLQKWREEKQKQMEQKKKQQPVFVVKTMEYKSDFGLYGGAPKNLKKMPKPEISINFVAGPKDKLVHHSGNGAEQRKNLVSTSSTRQPPKKQIQTDIKRVPTKTQTSRVTRQALKPEEPSTKPLGTKKVLTRGAKSSIGLLSSAHESKPRSRHVKGDLHLKMTAAAAAKKQENSGKPKEFLRAKPHCIPGRTTRSRSQAKQDNSEGDFQGSCPTTLKMSKSMAVLPIRTRNQFCDQRQDGDNNTDTDDMNLEKEESSPKRPRKSIAKGTPHNTALDVYTINKDAPIDSDDQLGKVKSVRARKTRQSGFTNVKREDQAHVDQDTEISLSSKKEANLISEINAMSPKTATPVKKLRSSSIRNTPSTIKEQIIQIESPEAGRSKVEKTFKKSEQDLKETFTSGEEQLPEQDTAPSVRKSRRSKANNGSKTPKLPVVKKIIETEISIEGEQAVCEIEVKETPRKRTRRSVLQTPSYQEDRIQEKEEILTQTPADQSITKTADLVEEAEVTNLAVTYTPGKSPRRTVLKLPLKEDDQSDSSDSSIQAKVTPRRKSLARLAVGSNSRSRQIKYTPGAQSQHPITSVMGSEHGPNTESSLTDTNTESDTNSTKERSFTPSRKSRRSVVVPISADKISPAIANGDSDDCNINSIKIPQSRMSRRSTAMSAGIDTAFTTVNSSSTNIPLASSAIHNKIEDNIGDLDKQEETLSEAKENNQLEDGDDLNVHMSPIADSAINGLNRIKPLSSKTRRVSYSGIRNSASKRKSGKKTPKSAHCSSRMRTRGSTPIAGSPFSWRRRSSSTVVSVSEEGTSNLKGNNCVEQAMTPNSSFAENKFPVNESGRRRRSVRRSIRKDILDSEEIPDGSVYRLGKPASTEAESGPLQELTVEKVEGETSYIEVPLDESGCSVKNSPSRSLTGPLEESADSQKETNLELVTCSNSSVETEPFTPRKSCNVTRTSQESMPSVEATPDLPARVPVRGFKTPFQAPRSAVRAKSSSARPRRKTEHSTPSRSPEEMVKILERSPMIEMTRRRSRHVSSPAFVAPAQFNFEETQSDIQNEVAGSKDATEVDYLPEKESSNVEPASVSATDAHVLERVAHFRGVLTAETDRLNQLCKTWEEISVYTFGISEDILGQIRTTVGKAQLLIAQRFKQFSGLVDKCEFNLGEQKTRPEDLQGFWEMIYFQVEDVNGLFDQLKEWQDNNWEKPKSPPKLILKKKPIAAQAVKTKGVSSFRAFLQERKKKSEKSASSVQKDTAVPTDPPASTETEPAKPNLEFDGGFFKVTSPARTTKGKRATLSFHTNSPQATSHDEDGKLSEVSKSNSLITPVAANKENQNNSQGASTPVLAAKGTPLSQAKVGMSGKRLSYVPVIPSPLLRDTTGITSKKKL
ncbi:hypothetical protein EGW08_020763 [Elysia chlorotica]|uniref:Disks large-associated protein 5 n=1 Tax=Elysia chlorotica TaxID=188477 RepID=A0A433SQE1_ELYCH|nr:hypothetical protein EGW08_020763 [Elysia chlorotica]